MPRKPPPGPGPGRPKGSQNKTTLAVKDAIIKAFDEVGGWEYLKAVAEEDPKTFLVLLSRCVPAEVKAEHTGAAGGPISVITGVPIAAAEEDPE